MAWLVAKLYAFCPMPQSDGATLASQLGNPHPGEDCAGKQQRFDELLLLPLSQIEPALQWALPVIAKNGGRLDWVRLTDELSRWERDHTRTKWAKEFLRVLH